MLLRTLVVDDESAARNTLRSLVNLFAPELRIVAEADSIQSALDAINLEPPDLLFLDMELKGAFGLSILDQVQPFNFEVIITTAHSQFALNAFHFGVADYLLKPITPSHLKRAVGRVAERHFLRQKANENGGTDQPVSITTLEGTRLFQSRDIIRLEANRNYTWVFPRNEKPILTSKTLSYFEEQLSPYGFLRIHHSHMVNPAAIRGFKKNTGELVMEDKSLVPISREKKKILGNYLGVL